MAKSKPKPTVIRGAALLVALSSSVNTTVKWFSGPRPYARDCQGRIPVLTVAQALVIAKAAKAGTYEGLKIRSGRVTHIREVFRKSDAPDFAFWEGRGCIRFHENDGPNISLKERRNQLCAAWDRAIKNPPPHWRKAVTS